MNVCNVYSVRKDTIKDEKGTSLTVDAFWADVGQKTDATEIRFLNP